MVNAMRYYTVENTYQIISVHMTLAGAGEALRKESLADRSGNAMFVKAHDIGEALIGAAAIAVFAVIGAMLAWRG